MQGFPTAKTRLNFTLTGIAEVLQHRRLAVPIYQRSYSWGGDRDRDQVEEYWSDLKASFGRTNEEYFLGTIVLSEEGANGRTEAIDNQQRFAIIDGQQRFATTMMLLAAIRDEFESRNDKLRAQIIHGDYIAQADIRSGEDLPRLVMNADDDEYFRRRIVNCEGCDPTNRSHELIDRAYRILRRRVSSISKKAGDEWPGTLLNWIDYLKHQVQVIVVEVPTEADAFLIFETLNDRGADLTIADLLKNYLFRRAERRLDAVRDAWVSALANLDTPEAGSRLFTDFLRHYWSSRHGATRERELYAKIKDTVRNPNHAVSLAGELQDASRYYAAILHSDHDIWTTRGAGMKDNVAILSELRLEQHHPLLLAALRTFSQRELRKLMRAIISWSVRGMVVGGIGGGKTERIYCEAAVKISNKRLKTTSDLFTELAEVIPVDEEFCRAFATYRVNRSQLARYFLLAIERSLRGESEPELVPNRDGNVLNLEHILPRSAIEKEWPDFEAEQRTLFINRLGNMALLQRSANTRLSNGPFKRKRDILKGSNLLLTRDAAAYESWTPAVINQRQQTMARIALESWPRFPE